MDNAALDFSIDIQSTLDQTTGDPKLDALFRKGLAQMKNKKFDKAAETFRDILKQKPDHFAAIEQLGFIARELKDHERALLFFKALTEHVPTYMQGYGYTAAALGELERSEEAIEYLKKAVALGDPSFAHAGLGAAYKFMGKNDLAAQHSKRAMEIQYNDPAVLYNYLFFHHKFKSKDEPYWKHVEKLVQEKKGKIPPLDLTKLYTILFKACEDIKDYDGAMEYAKLAGKIRKAEAGYDSRNEIVLFPKIQKYFDKAFFETTPTSGNESDLPVFICGMPRSGTTLLEQILHAHPDIMGIGEDGHLGKMLLSRSFLPPRNNVPYIFRQVMKDDNAMSLQELARDHLEYLAPKIKGAKRVVDKAIANYTWMGMLYMVFPKAYFIHLARNPLSSAISTYTRNFNQNQHPYSNDLHDLGLIYRMHYDIMAHWKEVFPGRMIEMSYEGIIEDTEGEARRVIEFLELPWNDACLEFYNVKKAVRTASVQQVRKPIYKSSLDTWRKYEKHLAPLVEGLGPYAPPESLYIIEKYGHKNKQESA